MRQELEKYGKSLIGKKAQSTVLTEISECGQKSVMEPAQEITGYNIVKWCGEDVLEVTLGGVKVFEDTLRSIK